MKRQVGSLYYERSVLSHDKLKLAELTQQGAEPQAVFSIRDPYVFEFLGLKSADVMSESLLEEQLLGKLQEFLLEPIVCLQIPAGIAGQSHDAAIH
ncbi:MAG: hypothetical protein PHG00_07690 [Methylococcales bacterium]|nr:hypothetical protein [Methylococcales bacterium]